LPRYDWILNRRFCRRKQGWRAVALSAQRLTNKNVAELPGIGRVDVFREETRPSVEWRPVGIIALYRPQIGHLHLEAAPVVDLVGFDDSCFGVFECPDHAGQHR